MLKKVLSGTGALATALWLIGMAQAGPLQTFTDIFDPDPEVYLSVVPATYAYSHGILDNGFNPLVHTLTSAHLTLDISDDAPVDKRERVTVELEGYNYGTYVITGTPLHLTVASALVQDGNLDVTLLRSKGDFLVHSSTLVAAQTPEPSTLLLLGSGLAGIVGVRLRRRQTGVVA